MAMEAAGFSARRSRSSCGARWGTSARANGWREIYPRLVNGMVANGIDREVGRPALSHARRVRRLRLSRIARGELRAAGVCVGVREVPRAGDLLRGDPQRAADGLLLDRSPGERRAPARRRRSSRSRSTPANGGASSTGRRAAPGLSPDSRHGRSAAHRARARAARRPMRSTICSTSRAARGWRASRSRTSPPPMRSRRGTRRGARRSGRCAALDEREARGELGTRDGDRRRAAAAPSARSTAARTHRARHPRHRRLPTSSRSRTSATELDARRVLAANAAARDAQST